MIREKKFLQILTFVSLGLIVADIVTYIILDATGVLNMSDNHLDIIFAISTPIIIFIWAFILVKDIEFTLLFRRLKIENKLTFGDETSKFYNWDLIKKYFFRMKLFRQKRDIYMVVFTPCAQSISNNLTRNEIVINFNYHIGNYLVDYFKNNKKFKHYDSTYGFYRGNFVLLLQGDDIRVDELISTLNKSIYDIALKNEIRIFVQPFFGIAKHDFVSTLDETFDNASLAKLQAETNFEPSAYYTPESRSGIKMSDVQDIVEGLEKKEFEVYYQPKFSLKESKFTSSEALVRWNSSKNGFLNPSQFIDKTEKAGLIHNLDMYVFERVCEDLNDFKRRGKRFVPVSVNFSMYEFYAPTFVNDIIKCMDAYNIPRNLIEIEITETTSQSNPFLCISIMKQMKEKGLRILMDDFGIGYSNFSNLRKVPIDCLKIDKSFINGMVSDVKTKEIVKFLIELGKNSGLEVIAEGVDSAAQVDILKKFHLDTIQGFYYSKPLPKKEYENFLLSNNFEKKGARK